MIVDVAPRPSFAAKKHSVGNDSEPRSSTVQRNSSDLPQESESAPAGEVTGEGDAIGAPDRRGDAESAEADAESDADDADRPDVAVAAETSHARFRLTVTDENGRAS